MEVAAKAHLFELEFAGAEFLGRAVDGVVSRMVHGLHVVRVETDFGRKELRIEYRVLFTRSAVHPADIADIGPRGDSVVFGSSIRRLQRLGYELGELFAESRIRHRRGCRGRSGRWRDCGSGWLGCGNIHYHVV